MFPNWDLTREGLGQASSLGFSPSPANGWEWATLSSGPARSYGRRLWAVTGGERVGASDKGRELASCDSCQGVEREAVAAWLPGWAVTAWLVMSEAPLGPGPGPETIFLMKNYHWPMWGLHLHPHNDTTPTEAPIITPFKHIGNSFIYSTNGHHTACSAPSTALREILPGQEDKTLHTLATWIGLRFEFSVWEVLKIDSFNGSIKWKGLVYPLH